MKKRASVKLGFVFSMQDIDEETDVVVRDHVVNVWGGAYERLEVEEAVLFEAELQRTCGDDMLDLMKKAMKVAADFGLETIVGIPADSDIKEAGKAAFAGSKTNAVDLPER